MATKTTYIFIARITISRSHFPFPSLSFPCSQCLWRGTPLKFLYSYLTSSKVVLRGPFQSLRSGHTTRWAPAEDLEGKATPVGKLRKETTPSSCQDLTEAARRCLWLTPRRSSLWSSRPTCRYTPTPVPQFPYINCGGTFGSLEIVFEMVVCCLPRVGLTKINSFLISLLLISLSLDFVRG